ncbi:MAG: hypothetical protein ACLUI3_06420 [Christensenellales bacterium]
MSLRLWANIGLISDKPYLELEKAIRQPVARAFAREEHERVRARLSCFHEYLTGTLYRVGAMDDRQPQKMILREVLGGDERDEVRMHLARRYLWASYDCMDYSGGVMLIHPALAEPQSVMRGKRRAGGLLMTPTGSARCTDILPEEIPLQQEMERAIAGAPRRSARGERRHNAAPFVQAGAARRAGRCLQTALIIYVFTRCAPRFPICIFKRPNGSYPQAARRCNNQEENPYAIRRNARKRQNDAFAPALAGGRCAAVGRQAGNEEPRRARGRRSGIGRRAGAEGQQIRVYWPKEVVASQRQSKPALPIVLRRAYHSRQ